MSAAWGALAGMLYLSFFGKVYAPAAVDNGNWSITALTVLVGTAWIISLIGLTASIAIRNNGEMDP